MSDTFSPSKMLLRLFGDTRPVPRGKHPAPPERQYTAEELADIQRRVSKAHAPDHPTVPAEARHAAELAKRRQLRRELEAAIDAPLIRSGLLTLQERREIWLREALRRRPVRAP